MKWTNLVIAAICFSFAVLQYNDPDPLYWAGFYGVIGLYAVLTAFGWRLQLGAIALAGFCLVMLSQSIPGVYSYLTNKDGQTLSDAMSREYPYIEETREFGGAVIGLLFVAISFFSTRRRVEATSASTQGS
jgi:hypothetical protein